MIVVWLVCDEQADTLQLPITADTEVSVFTAKHQAGRCKAGKSAMCVAWRCQSSIRCSLCYALQSKAVT